MSFISENFEIVGDSYIDSEDVSHRLKDVVSVAFGTVRSVSCLVVLTPYGNDCVVPLSISSLGLREGDSREPAIGFKDLLESAREEFLDLVYLASDPSVSFQSHPPQV